MRLGLDAAFCDVDLAGGDWIEVCRSLKAAESGLAVVVMTEDERNAALAASRYRTESTGRRLGGNVP
ncbi:MAG: hypothetical protein HKL90_16680 [Elusimicrobia bacterium]|nr:hypothetical protein [Elusimicrobiota bacterium]